ncbi:c-type cytochrome [Flavobacterium sp.]|jgi:cytochrome c|uniref:c-type cytochrome n=1 Tax=Flavobacterium sp. TaxID=239 RepID=UPI0037C136C4
MKASNLPFFVFVVTLNMISCNEKTAVQNPIDPSKATITQMPKELGQELFEGKGMCASCHKADIKVVGPSIQEIAKTYREKGASIAAFINEESGPLVDPSQYEIMKTNFAVTKAMSAEERKALEVYMMSFE